MPFHYHHLESDIGVRQRGSLEIDLRSTIHGWSECLATEKDWIEAQLRLAREIKPSAIVGDITPFAFPLARRAGLPSFLVASFTWDWILDFYKDDAAAFGEISASLRERYLSAGQLIYTPLSFGLPPVKKTRLVPLIGKRSSFSRKELRARLKLDDRPSFLISFGGFGLREMEKLGLDGMKDFQFIFLSGKDKREGNLIFFSDRSAAHEDLVAVSDAVITKPGYGISAEAILNATPMIYTSRGKFAEYEPLVEELKRYIPASYISHDELFNGGLKPYLEHAPRFSNGLLADPGTGAGAAAEIIAGGIA